MAYLTRTTDEGNGLERREKKKKTVMRGKFIKASLVATRDEWNNTNDVCAALGRVHSAAKALGKQLVGGRTGVPASLMDEDDCCSSYCCSERITSHRILAAGQWERKRSRMDG